MWSFQGLCESLEGGGEEVVCDLESYKKLSVFKSAFGSSLPTQPPPSPTSTHRELEQVTHTQTQHTPEIHKHTTDSTKSK